MTTMSEEELRQLRGSQIAMVYQEPMASLNPSMKIARQLMEVPLFHEGCSEQERLCARARDARRRAPARSQADHGELSAPDLGRPAAARGHRHGAAVEPGAAAAGRADHRARRHGRGRHRRADQGHQRALRHLDDLHLAQSRPDPRDLRSHHGHVLGRGGRGGHGRGGVRPHAPPLHARGCSPRSRCPAPTRTRARWCRSAASCRCRTSAREGCNFGPRCDHFRAGVCDHGRIEMEAVPGHPGH